jgi:UDP-N-acetylglucosamine acyltransferase
MSAENDRVTIHETAIVDPGAEIAEGCSIGPFSIIERGVKVCRGTVIGSHILIQDGTTIGEECHIHHGAVIGSIPQDLKFRGEKTWLVIGNRTVIREYATINRGTKANWKTSIGDDCLIMAYVHVAHDCEIGHHVILANNVSLAGHVVIEDYATLGGLVPVHQFTRIGQHSFVGGGSRVTQDVPPFIKVAGEPLRPVGLNIGRGPFGPVGLEKHGFPTETIELLKKAYRLLFRSNLNTSQAIERIRAELEETPEICALLTFIERSERGIVK